jgi:excisionase family DNA binding protein
MSSSSPWLTAARTAEYVGVSITLVYRQARSGSLRGIKVGGGRCWRFHVEDVERWLRLWFYEQDSAFSRSAHDGR